MKYLNLLLVILAVVIVCVGAQLPGGVSKEEPITDQVAGLALSFQGEAATNAGLEFEQFTPVSYAKQVVAGLNYFIKVDVGNGDAVILKIYQHFSGSTQLIGVKTGVTVEGPITYF